MSDADSSGFGKFVPGFEFMQNLAKQAAGGLVQGVQQTVPQLPNLSSWVAPTFNVEDLEKRIQELKAVHFWLDQNARALGATIQALEVQKMTLATLQGMNFSLGDVANALKIKASDSMAGMAHFAGMGGQPVPAPAPAPAPVSPYAASFASAPAPSAPAQAAPATAPSPTAADFVRASMFPFGVTPAAPQAAAAAEPPVAPVPPAPAPAPVDSKPAAGVVDPMQWWGALTQQFQAIATNALSEASAQTAVDAGKNITQALAREAVKSASEMTAGLTRGLVGTPAGAKESARKPSPTAKSGVAVKLTKAAGSAASKTASQATAKALKAVGSVAARSAKVAASAPPSPRAVAKASPKAPAKAAVRPTAKAVAGATPKSPAKASSTTPAKPSTQAPSKRGAP